MAKFVFTVPPLAGHVNPTLSIGAALLQQGHEVGWISIDPTLETRLPQGAHWLPVPPQPGTLPEAERISNISQQNVYGVESIRFLYDDVLIPLNRYLYHCICDLLDSYRPDLVIHDHQVFAGAMAAWKKNIPFVTSVTAPASVKMKDELPAIHQWENNKILQLQQQLGLHHPEAITLSQQLVLLYTTQLFFGDTQLSQEYHFTGPVTSNRPAHVAFNWDAFHAHGYAYTILVSIGTTFDHAYKKDFFEKLVAAFAGENIQVIVVSTPGLLNSWPENFIVQERVPQLQLLPYVDAVACHGGQNTVSETLQHGLPLVVVPIAYDQSYVASRVTATGCGLRLNYKRFTPAQLRQHVYSILTEPAYKNAAETMRHSFEQAGGTAYAVQLLENCLQTQPAFTTLT
ncbi:glycosyltransferase [Deminuibacter soli]|uniref:Glycosyl transferase n=1 Tax=Deminuibacter soli TaxID=2291815 RepID=A0A3E1NI24_9BACT|nr:nucleotide disphospho-sugar-binding domain-containing protein [Deminuibacter soli]RFM27504.1 glycosyl transferase [Deminuibacter soli]